MENYLLFGKLGFEVVDPRDRDGIGVVAHRHVKRRIAGKRIAF